MAQERSLPFSGPEESAEQAQAMLAQFRTDAYAHLAEMTVEHVLQPGCDYADEYEFGLDLILDGLERIRGARGNPPSFPSPRSGRRRPHEPGYPPGVAR